MSRHRELIVVSIYYLITNAVGDSVSEYSTKIESTGDSVVGSTFYFKATLYRFDKVASPDDYNYLWEDSIGNRNETKSRESTSTFSATYNSKGHIKLTLIITKFSGIFWYYEIAKNKTEFDVTDLIGGQIDYFQNNTKRNNDYVSSIIPVNTSLEIRKSDLDYLKKKASYITVYWFENCVYIGKSNDIFFIKHYQEPDKKYQIEALVVASLDPLPEPTTTSTTTTTTTTTSTTTTTTKPTLTSTTPSTTPSNLTTLKATESSNPKSTSVSLRKRRQINSEYPTITEQHISLNGEKMDLKKMTKLIENRKFSNELLSPDVSEDAKSRKNTLLIKEDGDDQQPIECFNKSNVVSSLKKKYGYFKRNVITKMPINNVTVTGSTWLQIGEFLNLTYSFQGSFPVEKCIDVFTEKPTNTSECRGQWINMTKNSDVFSRFYSSKHTIVFYFRNPLGVLYTQVAVNFYEAKKQSQLSVIIVPVSFILVAVILVVFGFAYYVESRNRYTVEVADFNFGETQSVDMEYKTFTQRLWDSIKELIPRRYIQQYDDGGDFLPSPSGSIGGGIAESSLPYGSMS